PNRAVKPLSADGTGIRWESRSPPTFLKARRWITNRLRAFLFIVFNLSAKDLIEISFHFYPGSYLINHE
ncbi:MAG: hypothetical protein AAFZ15_32725, partial [Bacteroidota bacterium]